MYWNAVLLMAWSLTTVTAILDSTKTQRYWEDIKPERAARYDNVLNTYGLIGGNKHFVTPVFPGNYVVIVMRNGRRTERATRSRISGRNSKKPKR